MRSSTKDEPGIYIHKLANKSMESLYVVLSGSNVLLYCTTAASMHIRRCLKAHMAAACRLFNIHGSRLSSRRRHVGCKAVSH